MGRKEAVHKFYKLVSQLLIRDRRLMCSHLSIAMTVIVPSVTMVKYWVQVRLAVVTTRCIPPSTVARLSATYKGLVIKPVEKSVPASPARGI